MLNQDELLEVQEPLYKKIWGDTWDGASGIAKDLDEAAVELDSVLATEMSKIEKATGAEKVAKGTENFKAAHNRYLELNRQMKATDAQIKFLDKKYQSAKLKYQAENRIGGVA